MTSLQSTSQKTGRRLKELDGLRAISVLLVVVYHIGIYQYPHVIAPHPHFAHVLQRLGSLGVRTFFVISGFVICRLLILEEKSYGFVSLKAFYIRRAFRILPPLLLYLGVLCLLLSTGRVLESWRAAGTAALFLNDVVPAQVSTEHTGWFVGHTWSLSVEEQFYLTFPALWILTRKIGRGRVFVSAFCLLFLWNLVADLCGWNGFMTPSIRAGFACICWGVVFACYEDRARRIARAAPSLAVVLIVLSFLWHPAESTSWESALFDSVYLPMAMSLLFAFCLERESLLSDLLRWKPIQFVGLMSYGIYLWQQLFTAPSKFYPPSGEPIAHLLPLLLVIAPVSYLFFEKPAMRLGRTLSEEVRQGSKRRGIKKPRYEVEVV